MTRARRLHGEAKATQRVPAELGEGRFAGLLSDPGSDLRTGPQATIRSRSGKQGGEGLLLNRGQARDFAGIGSALVEEGIRTALIVAMDKVTQPVGAEANKGSGIFGGASRGDEPQGVVAAGGGRVGRGAIRREEFVGSEMWVESECAWHSWIIHHDLV